MQIADEIKLIIFDLDGTLRRTLIAGQPCPRAPGEWEWLPRVKTRLAQLAARGYRFGAASNQDQVAYGHLSEALATQLIADLFNEIGIEPTIRICPHALEVICNCRKPEPGMLLSVMRACAVAPPETLFVGDTELDCEAARRAGVAFIWAWDFFGWNEAQHDDYIFTDSSRAQ